ncbi:hypothetical protein, partial [Vibrio metoecus]|uniref:hypothetical protein n=2 Tax=Vibrio metoecus TaxID=1481663 RepID=UPI001C3EB79F
MVTSTLLAWTQTGTINHQIQRQDPSKEQRKEAVFSPISFKLQRKRAKFCDEVNIAGNTLNKTISCKSRVNEVIERCKKALHFHAGLLIVARSRGFEPLTAWF